MGHIQEEGLFCFRVAFDIGYSCIVDRIGVIIVIRHCCDRCCSAYQAEGIKEIHYSQMVPKNLSKPLLVGYCAIGEKSPNVWWWLSQAICAAAVFCPIVLIHATYPT